MGTQVIDDRIDRIAVGGQPGLDARQEIRPIGCRATLVRLGEDVPGGRAKGAEDIAFATPTIVGFLGGTLGWPHCAIGLGLGPHRPLTQSALGALWPHLIQADHDATLGRRGVERFNTLLFFAKSGSTRSPNQVSCWRQRSPSAIKISSIRD